MSLPVRLKPRGGYNFDQNKPKFKIFGSFKPEPKFI